MSVSDLSLRVNSVTADSDSCTTESSQQSSSPDHSSSLQSGSELSPSSSELDIDSFLGPEYHRPNPSLLTYRIVGDNIVKPTLMTSENQTRSLRYFHAYAVRDRVDLSSYSSEPPVSDIGNMKFESLLPSDDDAKVLHNNLAILMGRILRKDMPFFEKFETGFGRHIMHEHYDDMCTESEVVS